MNFSNFGMNQQAPRYAVRSVMQAVVPSIERYYREFVAENRRNNAIISTGISFLEQTGRINECVNESIIGAVNVYDYMVEVQKMDQRKAIESAITICCMGLCAFQIVNNPQNFQGLDHGVISQCQGIVNQLKQYMTEVERVIIPVIRNEMGMGGQMGFPTQTAPVRRQGDAIGIGNQGMSQGSLWSNSNSGTGMGFQGNSQMKTGSLFTSNAPTPSSSGRTNNALGMDDVVVKQPEPVQPVQPEVVNKPNLQFNQIKHAVTYMDYNEHKTYGLLKQVLPSDSARRHMPQGTLENNFAALAAVASYVKLDKVERSDLQAPVNSGYDLAPFALAYGESDYSTHVNEIAEEYLQMPKRELERLTYHGTIIQLLPEFTDGEVLKTLLDKYALGIFTHGRLCMMMEELEKILKPETVLLISEKLASLATDYWRFYMGFGEGGLKNYYTGHDEVTEYFRREEGMQVEADLWSRFPTFILNNFLLNVPVNVTEDSETQHSLGFHVNFIRIPYHAAELPIGVLTENGESAEYGVVSRNVTPGLYNLCKTLYESGNGVLHHVVMTNEGRMVEVIKDQHPERDVYYVKEMKKLI